MKKSVLALALALGACAATASAAPATSTADAAETENASAEDTLFGDATTAKSANPGSYENPKLFDDGRHSDEHVTVSARYFHPKLTAKLKSDDIQKYYSSSNVDLVDTLGIDDTSSAPELIFSYRNMKLDYIHFSTDGHSDLTNEPIKVNDYEYSGKTNTDLDFDYLKFDVTNPLYHAPNFQLDWSYGITGMHWKANVKGEAKATNGTRSVTEHRSESVDFTAPVPMLGLKATAALGNNFSAHVALSGLPLGSLGHIFDGELGIAYFPADNVDIQAGYRIIDLKIDHDDDYGQFKLTGPWAGVRVWF
jgi:opacity protein-like surface antigen